MTDPRNIIPSLRIPADNLPVNEDIISTSHFGPDRISPNLQGVIRRLLLDISTTPQDILQSTYRTLSLNFDAVLNIWLSSKEMQEYFTLFDLNPTYQDYYIGYFGKTILNSLLYDIIENQENVAKKSYITTKFFAFIKNHDISVDTLVSMVKMLKSVVFRSNQFSPEGYFLVNVGFDIIENVLTKNFNDLILRLLNEYHNAIEVSSIISKTDIFGAITYVNQAFCNASGYSRSELIGRSHNIVRHPDTPDEVFKDLWSTIQEKKIWRGIMKNRSKDGNSRWFQSTIVPIVDENENTLEYICIRNDITSMKNALKNAEEYSNALNSSNLIIRFLPGGMISYVNEAFERFSGYKSTDLVGVNLLEQANKLFFPHNNNDNEPGTSHRAFIDEIRNHIREGKIWQGIIRILTRYKTSTWCATTIIPIFNSENLISEYIIVQTDITDIEISKQNLRSSYEKLQILDKQKDEFLNIASHELRTPMTSVRGYISMILDGDTGDIGPDTRVFLERVLGSSTRLLSLINDMLDIAKLESGKQEFTFENIDIRTFLQDCYHETSQLFRQKNQDLVLDIGFEHLVMQLDRGKLLQVMINLLGNAQKFTPENRSVTLRAVVDQDALMIHVIDTGVGIKKNDLQKIFEKFHQAKDSLTRNVNGTGLGLPIAKNIIEKMGGTIGVTSEPGKGSDFFIRIPITEK